MNCLVFGGTGFIGSHVCDTLVRAGHQVRLFHRAGSNIEQFNAAKGNIEFFQGDYRDPEQILAAAEGMDAVLHLISTTLPKSSNENPIYDVESNIVSMLYVLEACRIHQVKKIIYFSSGGTIYGLPQQVPIEESHPTNPLCSYGVHKLTNEKYLELYHHLHGIDYASLRISNPYGEGQNLNGSQGVVSIFLAKALREQPIEIWGDGSVVRDYLHVEDVASAAVLALEKTTASKIFNIGSGIGLSLKDVLSEIGSAVGREMMVTYAPARGLDVPVSVLDRGRAREELGWEPTIEFSAGLRRTAQWVSKQLETPQTIKTN